MNHHFRIDLLPGASASDHKAAKQLCEALDHRLEATVEEITYQLQRLLELDRRLLLTDVRSLGEEEVAARMFAAVCAVCAEKAGPTNARLNYTLNREDSTPQSRACKASVDRMRKAVTGN